MFPSIVAAVLLALVFVPTAWVAQRAWLTRREPPASDRATASEIAAAVVLYVIAFNLVFFVQELALVVPKALLPDVSATLFHNNHRWSGADPRTALYQGTGVLATLLLGTLAWLAAARTRLPLAFWIAFCGWFMALPQLMIGAFAAGSDVGMAYDYLGLGATAKAACAATAIVLVPLVASRLARHAPRHVALPVLLGILPILAYRVPREWIEVVFLPVIVAVIGLPWLVAMKDRATASEPSRWSWPAFYCAIALLLVFQLVLRPGITFG